MTNHLDETGTTDTELDGAKPRPPELIEKLDEIMSTPPEHTGVRQRPLSTSPNNEAEAQPGAIAPQSRRGRDPGLQDAGGGG